MIRNDAAHYLDAVHRRQDHWRDQLRAQGSPRADAAAWRVIGVLPAHGAPRARPTPEVEHPRS